MKSYRSSADKNSWTQRKFNAWDILERYKPKNDRELFRMIAEEFGVPDTKISFTEPPTKGAVADYISGRNIIRVGNDPDYFEVRPQTLMHETHHALDVKNNPLWPYRSNLKEGAPENEHHYGLPGIAYTEYLAHVLPYIKKEEAGLWFGEEDEQARQQAQEMFPWLKKVQRGASNKMPTPWDLPNARTLEKEIENFVKKHYGAEK